MLYLCVNFVVVVESGMEKLCILLDKPDKPTRQAISRFQLPSG